MTVVIVFVENGRWSASEWNNILGKYEKKIKIESRPCTGLHRENERTGTANPELTNADCSTKIGRQHR